MKTTEHEISTKTITVCDGCGNKVENAGTCYSYNADSKCVRCNSDLGRDLCIKCRPLSIDLPDRLEPGTLPYWLCQTCESKIGATVFWLIKSIAIAEQKLDELRDRLLALVKAQE